MKTAVVITAGRHRGKRGYIYGSLARTHPLVTKTLVFIGADDVAIPLDDLAPALAPPQLELFPTNEKTAADLPA